MSERAPARRPQPTSGVRGLVARRPLTAFLVIVFGVGWPVLAVPLLAERGVWIEIGLSTPGHPAELAACGLVSRCRRALVEPQETAPEIAITTAGAIDGGLEREGIALPQLHHGTDLTTWAVLDAAFRRERELRIGLEDTYWLPDARRAASNAELVAAAAERYGISPSG